MQGVVLKFKFLAEDEKPPSDLEFGVVYIHRHGVGGFTFLCPCGCGGKEFLPMHRSQWLTRTTPVRRLPREWLKDRPPLPEYAGPPQATNNLLGPGDGWTFTEDGTINPSVSNRSHKGGPLHYWIIKGVVQLYG